MNSADYKLSLTLSPEACNTGMVPTTSTSLTLALGDALEIALMEKREFQPEDFKILHPGGKLGAKLSTVGQFMRPPEEMVIVYAGAPVRELVLRMTEVGFGLAVIVDDDKRISRVI